LFGVVLRGIAVSVGHMNLDEWSESPSLVADILQVENFDAFLDQYWEKSPSLVRGANREDARRLGVRDLLDLVQAEQLIASAAGAPDTISIIDEFVARPVAGALGDSRALTVAVEAFARGASLLIPGLQHRLAKFQNLCRQFDNALLSHGLPLRQATTANAYVTPPRAQGFGPHYDNHCAVILQLQGAKRWSIHAPAEPVPVKRCPNVIPDGDLGDVVMSVRLEPGDVLYVPRGYPHYAASDDDVSLHVTLALYASTWSDAVGALACGVAAFRAAVRPRPEPAMRALQYYRSRLLAALDKVDVAEILQRKLGESLTDLPPLPGSRLQSLPRLERLTADSGLVRSKLVLAMVQREDGHAVLRCPGARIVAPGVMLPALEFIADAESFRVSDIPIGNAAFDRAGLVRLLIRHGLVSIAPMPEAAETRDMEVAANDSV
jgi:hypothetical protein